jgi:sodium-coupled neutral amino acid transporter 11
MVAFCVIVGDTIPRVLHSLFPSLADMSFLWLLTNRRAVMIVLILGVSFPLSLYRDISKADISPPSIATTGLTLHSLPRLAG